MSSRSWSNSTEVIVRIFVRSCIDDLFRTYGDIRFEKGAMTFDAWTDDQGDSQVAFRAIQSTLTLNRKTWTSILATCGPEELPPAPTPGDSIGFAERTVEPAYKEGTFASHFENLFDRIRALVSGKSLPDQDAARLLTQLRDAAVYSLRVGEADIALNAIVEFRDSVQELAQQGIVDAETSSLLLAGACPVREPCTRTVFHVRHRASGTKPDGSVTDPFSSIAQALQRAEAGMLCGVDLIVGGGVFIGDLSITRDTRIVGLLPDTRRTTIINGTITNHGPFNLDLENLTIWFPSNDGIVSDHPCARTATSDVQVIGAMGYGIHHRGGVLLANETEIFGTRERATPLSTGTGILMTCGAQAVFSNVEMSLNRSSGLILAGTGTRATAIDITVSQNYYHSGFTDPEVVSPWGGIHVRNGAELTAFGFSITENAYAGIRVEDHAQATLTGTAYVIPGTGIVETCGPDFRWHGGEQDPLEQVLEEIDQVIFGIDFFETEEERCAAGATRSTGVADRLVFTNGTISGTRAISVRGESTGGSNAAVGGRGRLRMRNFNSDLADFAGIILTRDGEADLNSGIVSRCYVGAAVFVPGYRISRLTNRVSYVRNVTDLGTEDGTLPVPEPVTVP